MGISKIKKMFSITGFQEYFKYVIILILTKTIPIQEKNVNKLNDFPASDHHFSFPFTYTLKLFVNGQHL